MSDLGQGTPLQGVLRTDHSYRLPDGQDFFFFLKIPWLWMCSLKSRFCRASCITGPGPGPTSKPSPYESQQTSRCAACSDLCSSSSAHAEEGRVPHLTTPVMPVASQEIALVPGRSRLNHQPKLERKSGGFSTKLFLCFVGVVCCSIFTWNSLAHPFC